ncbi:MAG: hypothetical protein ACRDL6_07495 [Solirubrobacterales bacterium]
MPPASNGNGGTPANYLGGDPGHPGAISGGQLAVDEAGLRFVGPGGRELRVPTDSLLGMSISGRAPDGSGRKGIHGTMRVAVSQGQPAELVFAVDRSAAARLQAQLNRELAARGRPALPHIEELMEFPAAARPAPVGPAARAVPARVIHANPSLAAAELGHRLDGVERSRRKRRVLPWVLLGAVVVIAEVAVPIILTRGG